jgi:small ligand-binding sensory domain FIST
LIEGAVISVAFNTRDMVLDTARQTLGKIADGGGTTAIIHSCIGRRYGLLSEPMAELELIKNALGGSFNCITTYANGEICPTSVCGRGADNRFHNQTLVACVFN